MHIAMSTLEPSAPLAYFASASGIYKHRRVHGVPRGDKLFQNIPLEVPKGFLFGYQTLESADCKGIYNRVPSGRGDAEWRVDAKRGCTIATFSTHCAHVCNYEANPRYCTFANSWSTPCREHSTCLYLCTVLLLRLVHET